MSSEFAIEISGLGKCYEIYDRPRDRLAQMLFGGNHQFYKEFWALRDVTLNIRKGETVGLIGRNGSGKSTLLQLVCGTLNPTVGDVRVHGRVAALLELGAGFNPEFSGVENVYMAASLYGLSREDIDQRFELIEAFADIGDKIFQPVKTYSSGMYVRLAFAVIAHVDADILVIDEALAVGDAFFTQKCMRFLRDFMSSGTVLFVSHDTASIRSLCDTAVWLEKGEIQVAGSAKEVCNAYLEAFFEAQQGAVSGDKHKTEQPKTRLPYKDQRSQFINASNLRNDIRVFEFDLSAQAFGKNGAEITSVQLLDVDRSPLSWIVGGEDVVLRVEVHALIDIDKPIVGFYVNDKLGQTLFGDNTYLSFMDKPVGCVAGGRLGAEFKFAMPYLAPGEYSITVAIADGTQEKHVQHHWIHDAIMFKSEVSHVSRGIIGLPMKNIDMKVEDDA